jgi:hypothetical protein
MYERRLHGITDAMQQSARELGCGFHRAWYSADGDFYALAHWATPEGARHFYDKWQIHDEPGEITVELLGDVGLVPVP